MLVLNKAKELSKAYRDIREEEIIAFLQNAIPYIQNEAKDIEAKLNLDELAEYVNLNDKKNAYTVLFNKVKDILQTFGCIVLPEQSGEPKPDTDWFFLVIKNKLTKFLLQWEVEYLYPNLRKYMVMIDCKPMNIVSSIVYMLKTIFSAAEHGEKSCMIHKDQLNPRFNSYRFLSGDCKLCVTETDTDFQVSGWL